jgi:hypothetical protein
MDITQALNLCRPASQWTLNGDTYAGLVWLDSPDTKPTELELEAAWNQAISVKIWPSKAEFWAEFSAVEKEGIITSSDIGIKMLDKELTMWSALIRADDPRIVAGVSALITMGILTQARATAILGRDPTTISTASGY